MTDWLRIEEQISRIAKRDPALSRKINARIARLKSGCGRDGITQVKVEAALARLDELIDNQTARADHGEE